MVYSLLADLVFLVHFAFVLFVILGVIAVWHAPKVAWLHLPAAGWGVFIEFSGRICPLTPWEQKLRMLAGEQGYTGGFVEHYLLPIVYPPGLTREVQLSLGVLVLLINGAGYFLLWRKLRRASESR
ncbi:MAG: DUF2784 domain-containing protein [Pseudomonadota bacterium]